MYYRMAELPRSKSKVETQAKQKAKPPLLIQVKTSAIDGHQPSRVSPQTWISDMYPMTVRNALNLYFGWQLAVPPRVLTVPPVCWQSRQCADSPVKVLTALSVC